jgi:hypothetical protein
MRAWCLLRRMKDRTTIAPDTPRRRTRVAVLFRLIVFISCVRERYVFVDDDDDIIDVSEVEREWR